jgi:L-threonylcarbamoyladenylate synthase
MAIDMAADVLQSGGLVLFPSDTVYVVASLARTGESVSNGLDRLFAVKNRGRGPSFPWLVGSPSDLDVYGTGVTDDARTLAENLWPCGLTIVVRASSAVPRVLAREDGSVALRCSAAPIAAGLIRSCGLPLISTGANSHGNRPPCTYGEVADDVMSSVDFAIEDPAVSLPGRSTIVDCTTRQTSILREGVVSRESVDGALGIVTPFV